MFYFMNTVLWIIDVHLVGYTNNAKTPVPRAIRLEREGDVLVLDAEPLVVVAPLLAVSILPQPYAPILDIALQHSSRQEPFQPFSTASNLSLWHLSSSYTRITISPSVSSSGRTCAKSPFVFCKHCQDLRLPRFGMPWKLRSLCHWWVSTVLSMFAENKRAFCTCTPRAWYRRRSCDTCIWWRQVPKREVRCDRKWLEGLLSRRVLECYIQNWSVWLWKNGPGQQRCFRHQRLRIEHRHVAFTFQPHRSWNWRIRIVRVAHNMYVNDP